MTDYKKIFKITGTAALSSVPALLNTSCAGPQTKEKEVQKPLNIVYIMCDDHSYQTVSA